MIENKEQLTERVRTILSAKPFTEKAKDNLLQSILFAYQFYGPPKYIKKSKDKYIMEYLDVLENMEEYTVIDLSEINDMNEPAIYFRSDIKRSEHKEGNLELIDGKYVPVSNGSYYCSCNGFTRNKEKRMFTLDQGESISNMTIIHHEMTHLSEGKYPFLIDSSVPFSFEIRKMFYEGRAVTRESYISVASDDFFQVVTVEDEMSSYAIGSKQSYPLYGNLYQLLQIMFGDDFLEEMAKNNDKEKNMIEELKKKYPNIPVEEIFSHIIYILGCYLKEKSETLASAVGYLCTFHSREVEFCKKAILIEKEKLKNGQESLGQTKREESEILYVLENPELLKQEYEKAKQAAKDEIETLYKEGSYSEEEYRSELQALETEATLEYYTEVKKQELENNRQVQISLIDTIKHSKEEIKESQYKLELLEKNQLSMHLEKICLKNPSLESSFSYLENMALTIVREEANRLPKADPEFQVLLDKIRVLLELKEKTILLTKEKKNSLVS